MYFGSRPQMPRPIILLPVFLCFGVLSLSLPSGAARAEPTFSADATEACEAEVIERGSSQGGHAVMDCVGLSAQQCMEAPQGDTTIGMMECLDKERLYWDARLNAAYADRIAIAKEQDAELKDIGSAADSIEDALRMMQREWIAFRDAACLYERAQWMGGTGGGPASIACHMNETARQALKLEGWWGE